MHIYFNYALQFFVWKKSTFLSSSHHHCPPFLFHYSQKTKSIWHARFVQSIHDNQQIRFLYFTLFPHKIIDSISECLDDSQVFPSFLGSTRAKPKNFCNFLPREFFQSQTFLLSISITSTYFMLVTTSNWQDGKKIPFYPYLFFFLFLFVPSN